MKKDFILKMALALLLFVVIVGCPNINNLYTKEVEKTFNSEGKKELKLENISGNISISRSQGSQISVKATKISKNEGDLSKVEIEFKDEEIFQIKSDYKDNSYSTVAVDYIIKIPQQLLVTIKATTGDIDIRDIDEVSNISTEDGDVVVQDSKSIGSIKVTSGGIVAKVSEIKSDVSLKTVNGSIKLILTTSDYKTIDHKTTSGKVTLDALKDSMGQYTINLETTNGNITVSPY